MKSMSQIPSRTFVPSAFHRQKPPASPRILLIEDDKLTQTVHKTLLQTLNCRVDVAGSGLTAKALFNAVFDYDLVLCDIGLPDCTGIELATWIRQRNPIIPLIAVTADADQLAAECLAAGMNACYRKPCLLNDLESVLTRYLPSQVVETMTLDS